MSYQCSAKVTGQNLFYQSIVDTDDTLAEITEEDKSLLSEFNMKISQNSIFASPYLTPQKAALMRDISNNPDDNSV